MVRTRLAPAGVFALAAAAAVGAQRACYRPDGEGFPASVAMTACGADGGPASACCRTGDVCLGNGLCFGAEGGMLYRGGCTDKEWDEEKCTDLCLESQSSDLATIFACDPEQHDGTSYHWCGDLDRATVCSSPDNDTDAGGTLFRYSSASAVAVAATYTLPAAASTPPSPTPTPSAPRSGGGPSFSGGFIAIAVAIPLALIAGSFAALYFCGRARRTRAERRLAEEAARREEAEREAALTRLWMPSGEARVRVNQVAYEAREGGTTGPGSGAGAGAGAGAGVELPEYYGRGGGEGGDEGAGRERGGGNLPVEYYGGEGGRERDRGIALGDVSVDRSEDARR